MFTYNVRAGVSKEEYEDYMRAEDFPRFRSRPEVLGHRAWHVVRNVQGEEAFTRFDLIEVRDFDLVEPMLADPEVAEHVRQWIERWSEHGPDVDDPARNFKVSYLEEVWG
jgi:hypothetical protein